MMFSGATWALLLIGALFTRRWAFLQRVGTVTGPVLIGLTLIVELAIAFTTTDRDPGTLLTITLAFCGFLAWIVTLRWHGEIGHYGGVAWTLAGVLMLGQTHDLLPLGLGWEILRHGVRLTASESHPDRPDGTIWILSLGWWLAISGLILFGGTTDVDTLMHLARQLYTPINQAEPSGRASLLLVGALALLVVSVCGAMLLPASREHHDDAVSRQIETCGQMHLQWGAGLVLATVFRTGCPGLSGPLTELVSVMTVAAWALAILALGRTQRWGDIAEGAIRFHGGVILFVTWLLLAQLPHPSAMQTTLLSAAPSEFVWGQELLHGGIAMTALLAALSWRERGGTTTDFIEASRGAATTSLGSVLWTLLPLASLVGFPGVWGSWTRLTTGAAVLGVQAMREDELAVPVGSIIAVAAMGTLAISYLIRGLIHIIAVTCWEPLIGRPRSPGNGWPQIIAALLCFVLIVVGVCPMVVPLVMHFVSR